MLMGFRPPIADDDPVVDDEDRAEGRWSVPAAVAVAAVAEEEEDTTLFAMLLLLLCCVAEAEGSAAVAPPPPLRLADRRVEGTAAMPLLLLLPLLRGL